MQNKQDEKLILGTQILGAQEQIVFWQKLVAAWPKNEPYKRILRRLEVQRIWQKPLGKKP